MVKKGFRFLRSWYQFNRKYLKNEFSVYNSQKEINFLNAYEEVHTRMAPVFVLSTGRCGTTLLTVILNQDENIEVNHDLQPIFLYHCKIAYEKHATEPNLVKQIADTGRFEMILDVYLRGHRYIETNPYSTFFAFQLYELFPQSKFLHLVRHPGDFVRSAVSYDWFSGKNMYDIARIEPLGNADNFRKESIIAKTGWLWNEYNTFIEKFKASGAPERLMYIRAEDMFKDRKVIQQILNFMGGRHFSEEEINKLLSKPVNEQSNFNLPKYKDWNEAQKQELKRYISPALINQYGYQL